jgi:hypothetical protein
MVAAGEADGARISAERATRVGMPSAERELFDAWIDVVAGEPVRRGLPAPSTPLLFVILELLLRVGDFEAFEALHPLLEQSDLPRREQRELLGCIYLRRGFLKSAAQEWIAVCSEQADARALVGLGRVAAAQGLEDDVTSFASEALALDPGSVAARELLSRQPTGAITAA